MFKLNQISSKVILGMLALFSASAFSAQAQTCSEFKNRTYIAFGETVFDNPAGDKSLRGAFAFKVKFDANGKIGTARMMVAQNPPEAAAKADQLKIKFTCNETGSFTLSNKAEGDNAYFDFKSFDKGARIWVRSNISNRNTPFWMLELPADARGEQFPNAK